MNRVLIVDDEPELLRDLVVKLCVRQYNVATAATGAAALESASREFPNAVILGLDLPDIGSLDIIRGLRAWSPVPIIVLTGRTDPRDKILALDAGADDYITKPFAIEELLAELRAMMRRPTPEQAGAVMGGPTLPSRTVIGDHIVDIGACTVRHIASGEETDPPVRLTPIEWGIVSLLLRNPGVLITKRRILHEIWGPDSEYKRNYLRIHMSALRRKLEHDPAHPRHLITEPGVGYRFDP